MTRAVSNPLVSYDGSGSTGPFSVPFYFLTNSHVVATKIDGSGTKTTLVEGTNFTLTGTPDSSGVGYSSGSLTLVAALNFGETLTLYRETPRSQDQSIIHGSNFSSRTTMNMVDRCVDMVQELSSRIGNFLLDRSGYGPTHVTNKGKYIKLSADGTRFETAESVDVSGLTPGIHCLAVYTSNIALSGAISTDGVTPPAGSTVLVQNNTTKSQNGVYITAAGAWARHPSFDSTSELQCLTAFTITSGAQYAGSIWVQLVKDPVIGTSDLVFGLLGATINSSAINIANAGQINWNSSDLIWLHSSNLITMSGGQIAITFGGGATSEPLRLVNTTDAASVQVSQHEGDRATPAANDEAYDSYLLSDSAGNQTEFVRITWKGTTVTDASEAGRLQFGVMTAGTLADELYLTGAALTPATNDGLALGTTALAFADAFWASGAVQNWNNGDVTLTHSANALALAGGSLSVTDATAAATAPVTAKNSTDNATVKGLTIAGDRATVTNNDSVYAEFQLSDSAGNQDEFARIAAVATDVASGSEDGEMRFSIKISGTLSSVVSITGTSFNPSVDNAFTLGATSFTWAGMHLGNSAPIRWATGHRIYGSTNGLYVDQQTLDTPILSFRSDDVTHGVTTAFEENIFGTLQKTHATGGGVRLGGVAANGNVTALQFYGVGDTDTTKSTAGTGVFSFDTYENNGTTTPATMTANSNLLVVRSNTTTRFILDAEGESHQDVGTSWISYDFLDDVHTLNSIAYHVARDDDPIKQKFEEWTLAKRENLEALKLVSFGEDGRPFMNMSKLAMLNTGAIRQLGEKLAEREEKIAALERRLLAIESKKSDA